jgi:hypothetical protein
MTIHEQPGVEAVQMSSVEGLQGDGPDPRNDVDPEVLGVAVVSAGSQARPYCLKPISCILGNGLVGGFGVVPSVQVCQQGSQGLLGGTLRAEAPDHLLPSISRCWIARQFEFDRPRTAFSSVNRAPANVFILPDDKLHFRNLF